MSYEGKREEKPLIIEEIGPDGVKREYYAPDASEEEIMGEIRRTQKNLLDK